MLAIKGNILIIEDEVLVAVNYKDCLEARVIPVSWLIKFRMHFTS